jgi:type II secretory pathway pseudopilin PulG
VIAVLAAIAIPKFVSASARSKESSLHADLKLVRNAVALFQNDTGYFPMTLTDIAATSAPTNGKDSSGATQGITATNWRGPYIASVPNDPVSSAAFNYSITAGSVGNVTASASGSDSAGVLFSTY